MIQIDDPQNCCGCSACASICPKDAITMTPDGMGFLYPKVDVGKCIDCGLCEKVCSFNSDYDKSLNLPSLIPFGVRHKDIKEIARSQSGAAFVVLSDWILEQGGVVYGAGYTGHFRVVHKRAITKEERDEFRGSKYVQSDMNGVFRLVKQDLQAGHIVCFSGTPCQTSGLRSYIAPRLRENLYLVDIICHGVPGPFLWRDYLKYLEKKEGMPITAVNFRDKSLKGWHSHVESFRFADTYTYTYTYTYLFYTHITLRSSCGNCPFCNTIRPSDITIGDFWGVEKSSKTFAADNKGCSLILLNTEKGKSWFNKVKDKIDLLPVELKNCLQGNLQRPSKLHSKHLDFERDYLTHGFAYVKRKYRKFGLIWWIEKIKQKLNSFNK